MREIRQSGSEGGGIGHTDPPYPYSIGCLLTGTGSFLVAMAGLILGSSPRTAMTGLESQSFRRLV
jgi:hypothetical protein